MADNVFDVPASGGSGKGHGLTFSWLFPPFCSRQVEGHGKITFSDGSSGRPRQEGTFKDRKLATGGVQKTAVNQAKEAQTAAESKASQAKALK